MSNSGFSRLIKVRVICLQDKKVLLLKQTNSNGGNYTLPGGTVEDHEYPILSLIREVYEETGLKLDPSQLRLAHTLYKRNLRNRTVRVTLYFTTTQFKGEPESKEPKKFKHAEWFALTRLPADLSDTVKHVLKCFKQGVEFSQYP